MNGVTVKSQCKKRILKKFHDLDVSELDGLAIMADTDNSKIEINILFSEYLFF